MAGFLQEPAEHGIAQRLYQGVYAEPQQESFGTIIPTLFKTGGRVIGLR